MNPSGSSLAWLMRGVALIAAHLAAMGTHSELGAKVVVFVTGLVMLSAIAAAAYRRGPSRAFWAGFALFGWAYVGALAAKPWDEFARGLLTSRLLEEAYNQVHPPPVPPADAEPERVWDANTKAYVTVPRGTLWAEYHRKSFTRAGHSLATFLLAVLGGSIARIIRGGDRFGPTSRGSP